VDHHGHRDWPGVVGVFPWAWPDETWSRWASADGWGVGRGSAGSPGRLASRPLLVVGRNMDTRLATGRVGVVLSPGDLRPGIRFVFESPGHRRRARRSDLCMLAGALLGGSGRDCLLSSVSFPALVAGSWLHDLLAARRR